MKANQKGFSVVEILIVIVVVGLLGAVGWLVHDHQKSKTDDKNSTTQISQQEQKLETAETPKDTRKAFDCKSEFSVKYSEPLKASMTTSDPPQCLISNVIPEAMPPVGPLPPEQVGLFFNSNETTQTTSKSYLTYYIEQSKQDYGLTLKGQEEITLDNGKTATLATVYGGHPGPQDFYFFIYIKNGKAITTSFAVNTNYNDLTRTVLKSIQ
jgi:prepilin-type N-terminal cleavage/methylation domain-containing protein